MIRGFIILPATNGRFSMDWHCCTTCSPISVEPGMRAAAVYQWRRNSTHSDGYLDLHILTCGGLAMNGDMLYH